MFANFVAYGLNQGEKKDDFLICSDGFNFLIVFLLSLGITL